MAIMMVSPAKASANHQKAPPVGAFFCQSLTLLFRLADTAIFADKLTIRRAMGNTAFLSAARRVAFGGCCGGCQCEGEDGEGNDAFLHGETPSAV